MKAKFNAIDFIIILVIAAIIAVGSYYLVSTMGGGTSGNRQAEMLKQRLKLNLPTRKNI